MPIMRGHATVAASDPHTICALHLGWAEGFAEQAGDTTVAGLTIRKPDHAGCVLELRTR